MKDKGTGGEGQAKEQRGQPGRTRWARGRGTHVVARLSDDGACSNGSRELPCLPLGGANPTHRRPQRGQREPNRFRCGPKSSAVDEQKRQLEAMALHIDSDVVDGGGHGEVLGKKESGANETGRRAGRDVMN